MDLKTLAETRPDVHRAAADDVPTIGECDCSRQNADFSSMSAFRDSCIPFAKRFLKFGFVGTSGMAVDLGLYGLLLSAMPQARARALAIALAMTWNFIWNRQVTFADARRHHWFRQYLGYCASCLLGALVNWWTSLAAGALHPWLAEHPLVAAMIGVVAGMAFNFAFCLLIVFRPHEKPEATVPHDQG